MFDHLPDLAFFAKDRDFRFMCASRRFMDRFGFHDENDIVGKNDFDLFPDRLAENFRRDDEEVFASGKPKLNIVELFFTDQGIPDWFVTNKLPLFDDKGRVIGLMGTVQSFEGKKQVLQPYLQIDRALAYIREHFRTGVSITELSPAGAPMPGLHTSLSGSVGRLHAKVATVDGRWLLVGSLNMDARSARTNTELVLVVDSPRLADEMAALLQAHWQHDHYKVRRVPDVAAPDVARQAAPLEAPGNAPWRTEWVGAGVPDVHRSEPRVSTAQRMWFSVVSLFVPEEWL